MYYKLDMKGAHCQVLFWYARSDLSASLLIMHLTQKSQLLSSLFFPATTRPHFYQKRNTGALCLHMTTLAKNGMFLIVNTKVVCSKMCTFCLSVT